MKRTSIHKAGFGLAFKRELLHYRNRSGEILLTIGILLTSMVVVAWIFSTGTLTNLPIVVVDDDASTVSRTYIRMLDATPEMHVIDTISSPAHARELLEQASIYAFVHIPKNFSKNLKIGRQSTVTAWYNGQFLTVSGVISKSLRVVTGTMSAGIKMTSLKKRGESSLATQVNFKPVQSELRTLFNPFQNYQYFLVASLLPAMLQVFIMVWTVYVVGREFKNHTNIEWIKAGNSIFTAIGAKALPVFLLASLIGMACLTWLYGVAAWPINGSLGILILAWELMVLAYIVLGLLFAAFAPQLATALSFTVFFTAPAFAYAGITFPQQSMPIVAQLWTYILPVRTLLRLQIEQAELGAPVSNSIPELLILFAFILLPLPFAIGKLRKRCETTRLGG